MANQAFERSQAEYLLGIKALEEGRRSQASAYLFSALDLIGGIQNIEEKRNALAEVAKRYYNFGFSDLALMAFKEARDLSVKLGDHRLATHDLLAYGNALNRLGKKDEAEKTFQTILRICLDQADYINAAAASTNLSNLAVDRHERKKAIELLNNSLRYLERKPHPETEINTRFNLVQIMELEQYDPESVIEMANELHSRFSEKLRPEQRKVIAGYLNQALSRYLKAHPDIDGESWTAKHLPYLTDWERGH